MFVVYNGNSSDDIYRTWNPTTNRIHRTRDIIWLKRMFYKTRITKKLRNEDTDIASAEVGEKGRVTLNDDDSNGDDYGEENDDEEDNLPPLIPRGDAYDSDSDDDLDEDKKVLVIKTKSGRVIRKTKLLLKQAAIGLTHKEANYCAAMITLSTLKTDGKE